MAFLSTALPWLTPFTPIDRKRIVVVANPDVSWSLAVCKDYCRARGVPVENVISCAMGTASDIWTPAPNSMATIHTVLLTPLNTIAWNISAQAVLLGPGAPACVYLREEPFAGNFFPVSLAEVASLAINYPPASYGGNGVDADMNADIFDPGGSYQMRNVQAGSNFGNIEGTLLHFNLGLGTGNALTYTLAGASEGSPTTFTSANPLATSYLGANHHYFARNFLGFSLPNFLYPSMPVGRIGMASYGGGGGGPPVPETEAIARQIIDQTSAAMTHYSRSATFDKPIVFNIRYLGAGDPYADEYAYFRYLCDSWGFNTAYCYYDGAGGADGNSNLYAPFSSQTYSRAQIDSGSFKQPHYLMLGNWENVAPSAYVEPWASAWPPLEGAGVATGPSNGFQYALQSLYRGGACGLSDASHIAGAYLIHQLALAWNLLRGMTWLEAFWYGGRPSMRFPCGDPLWAPYGLGDPGPQNPAATTYQGRQHIDERTGFKVEAGELLHEWNGLLVKHPEDRHPLDRVRSKTVESPRGSTSPETADNFLVNPVKPTDL